MTRTILALVLALAMLVPTNASYYSYAQQPLFQDSGNKLDSVGYSQYRKFQSPEGGHPSVAQIQEDMKILEKITNRIRVYEAGLQTQSIAEVARDRNIDVDLSVNIDRNDVDWQIDIVANIVNKYPGTVKSIILDKATRGTSLEPVPEIKSVIDQIRARTNSDMQVTVADSVSVWVKNPEL